MIEKKPIKLSSHKNYRYCGGPVSLNIQNTIPIFIMQTILLTLVIISFLFAKKIEKQQNIDFSKPIA